MKITLPRTLNHTCRSCKAKRLMKLEIVKKRSPRALCKSERRKERWGSRGNQGRYSKVISKSNKKVKRLAMLLACLTCLKKQPWSRPRAKDYVFKETAQ